MAKTVAQGAPERLRVTRRTERFGGGLTGNARLLAEPAYKRLLDAEPILRRLIPALIVVFLIVMAATRCLSLMTWRDDVERNAKAILGLATAHLVNAMSLAAEQAPIVPESGQEMLQKARQIGSLSRSHVVVLTDGDFKVVAISPEAGEWIGKPLDAILSGGQPLFIFGERAGAMEVDIDGQPWFATLSLAPNGTGAAATLVPADAVFAEWRRTVSLNVTLFVLTGGVLIVILYAYFSQATRAQTADRIYVEAHQRIDLALVRGRCGLWDWDMVRGQMYWSRSMYDMLGYKPCEEMLSFGEVDEIIHPDDGNLFKLANKIVSREVDHIDQVFRMRHADGRWVWIRARAQVVDPEASELHLIGIAVDVTEQRHLAQRSETADLRLRTAIE
ncbi:MAG: PAS domain-containing protein, partial [Rhizobiaceae bacterium]|nr:PAS domain-containing protein [Rhizobiaceae bacterium]